MDEAGRSNENIKKEALLLSIDQKLTDIEKAVLDKVNESSLLNSLYGTLNSFVSSGIEDTGPISGFRVASSLDGSIKSWDNAKKSAPAVANKAAIQALISASVAKLQSLEFESALEYSLAAFKLQIGNMGTQIINLCEVIIICYESILRDPYNSFTDDVKKAYEDAKQLFIELKKDLSKLEAYLPQDKAAHSDLLKVANWARQNILSIQPDDKRKTA